MIDLNPLDVIKKRKLNYMPPHFLKVQVNDFDLFEDSLENWIVNKLKGRYSLIRIPSVDENKSLKLTNFLGFEDHKEITYFTLACPYFRRKQ
jgi:hypothetical protein